MTAAGYPRLASIWKIGSGSKGSYMLNKFGAKLRCSAYYGAHQFPNLVNRYKSDSP
jgi:hypothetical protein